jgi:Ca-activated chloride channel family protein
MLGLGGKEEHEFNRTLSFQRVPSIESAISAGTLEPLVHALTGIIYAASFPSTSLLISEDSELAGKHRYLSSEGALFTPASLKSATAGSNFQGGFLNLPELARKLADGGEVEHATHSPAATIELAEPAGIADKFAGPQNVFRADARLVMIFATVTDSRGHYVDDLTGDSFEVLEDGRPQKVTSFESHTSGVSCALLLDTTASMHLALPAVKSAAMRFIRELRPVDSVAVYNFSGSVSLLQPFSTDKDAAQRAVLGTLASGQTALFDALTRVTRDLMARGGKKVIVLFTDGEDNASTLSSALAVRRMKSAGTPVYTIAQGQALTSHALVKELSDLSSATGGLSFQVEQAADVGQVFGKISQDLAHGYLMSFQPSAPGDKHEWHKLKVVLKSDKRRKIRAREGYYRE